MNKSCKLMKNEGKGAGTMKENDTGILKISK